MTNDRGQTVSRRELAMALSSAAAFGAASSPSFAQLQPHVAEALEPTRLKSIGETLRPEIVGDFGIVSAGRHYAVAAGVQMLMAGGNATDAGVAAVFAASVTEISHFGFGGEAPAIIYDARTSKVSVVNGQGVAPGAATPAVFAPTGIIPGNGPNGATVPAVLDAMANALAVNGTRTLHEVMEFAITLADGFVMYNFLAEVFASQKKATSRFADAYTTYYPSGHIPASGDVFRQPNLARTMRTIADASRAEYARSKDRNAAIRAGRDVFYKGDIARRIGAALARDGGLMRYDDLARYEGKIEAPFTADVFGYRVCKSGFWSQGPTQLMLLQLLEAVGIGTMQPGSAEYLHTVAEAIKLVFDDRNMYFGDPDFASVPMTGLLSKAYAKERSMMIAPRASLNHRYGNPWRHEGRRRDTPTFTPHRLTGSTELAADTTAIEVVDRSGNLFSCTPSSGWLFGGAYIAGDTGVPMSNRMTVFDLDAASPNVLAPYKRPRTTLSPSVVLKGGKPFLAIGTPGGDNQDQQIANVLLRVLAFNEPLQAAVEAPRINSLHFHTSFGRKEDDPGRLEIEDRVPASIRSDLEARGHKLDVLGPYGVSTGVVTAGLAPNGATLRGGADVRRERYSFGW